MTWDYPLAAEIGGQSFSFRNRGDYRVVLDAISALTDDDLPAEYRVLCALRIVYGDLSNCKDTGAAIDAMMRLIRGGDEETTRSNERPLMNWEQDFRWIAPAVSRVLGYEVRDPERYTHWWTFIGAYLEIGNDCAWSNIVRIRAKLQRGKKLEKWEQEFYREHRAEIDIKTKLNDEERQLLARLTGEDYGG